MRADVTSAAYAPNLMFEKASALRGLSSTDVLRCAALGATYFFAVRASEHLYGSLSSLRRSGFRTPFSSARSF